MRLIVTAEELIDSGCWDQFCEEQGINPWAVNEGRMDSDEEFVLTEDVARSYGFLRQRD